MWAPLVLAFLWLIMILFVNPVGDFPLNDDWCYGRVVYSMVEDGKIQFPHWGAPVLIAQALWGVLFCVPFGFSFTALRISTLVLALFGILSLYQILVEIRSSETKYDRFLAFFGAVLIATNPLFFLLSNSFMTDIPFFSLTMMSILFFIRGIKLETVCNIAAGTFFALLAIFIRQVGFVIPVSFAIAFMIKNKFNKRVVSKAFLPVLLILAVYIVYTTCMKLTVGLPTVQNEKLGRMFAELTHPDIELFVYIVTKTVYALLYLGLFLLPFSLINFSIKLRQLVSFIGKRNLSLVFSCIFLLTTLFLLLKRRIMPVSGNVLYDIGLGPPLLYDVYNLNLPNLPQAPVFVWLIITFAAIAGVTLLSVDIFSVIHYFWVSNLREKDNKTRKIIIFIFLACTLYFGPLAITGFFDRYLIFLVPLLMILVSCWVKETEIRFNRFFVVTAVMIIVGYSMFAVAATHDYLSWNKARWHAIDYLLEDKGIPPQKINGGFEFNGWYHDPYAPDKPRKKWRVYEDNYIVTFGPLEGYDQIKEYDFSQWLFSGKGKIRILQKESSGE